MLSGVVAILSIFVVFPGMVLYTIYAICTRRGERESGSGAPAVAELLALAHKMESRIEALERMLDAEAPRWREKP